MFLDPEPRRQNMSVRSSSPASSIDTRTSLRSMKSAAKPGGVIKRKPLQERSRSEINQQTPKRNSLKSTVRLVQQSPSPTRSVSWTQKSQESMRIYDAQEMPMYRAMARERAARAVARRLSFSRDCAEDDRTSELEYVENPAGPEPQARESLGAGYLPPQLPKLEFPPRVTLVPNSARRQTASSVSESHIFTIPETDSVFASSSRKSDWFSDDSTLRNTPDLTDKDIQLKMFDGEEPVRHIKLLEPLQETSPERVTIRTVADSEDQSSLDNMSTATNLPGRTTLPDKNPQWSAGMPQPPSRASILDFSMAPSTTVRNHNAQPRPQFSHESLTSTAQLSPSSPVIVVYESDSSRPQTSHREIRYMTSVESIQSRIQYPTIIRRTSSTALTASSSWITIRESPSIDTLPPLQITRKRTGHRRASSSLDSTASQTPIPRWPSRGRLSSRAAGIQSSILEYDDDRNEPSTSLRARNWSIASDVFADEGPSVTAGERRALRSRRWSDSQASLRTPAVVPTSSSSETEAGDMTLGIYREESAKPPPLFGSEEPWIARLYSGTAPPIPSIPLDESHSEEHDDTLTELQPNALQGKRSARSLRPQRNNSFNDRSRPFSQISMIDSDRMSVASSVFPTWAKQYYRGTFHLLSASNVSLGRPRTPRVGRHERTQSQWTARSYFSSRSMRSRPGTGHSTCTGSSVTSRRFMPNFLRSRFAVTPQYGSRSTSRGEPTMTSMISQPESIVEAHYEYSSESVAEADEHLTNVGEPNWSTTHDHSPSAPSEGRRSMENNYSPQRPTYIERSLQADLMHAGVPFDGPALQQHYSNRMRSSAWMLEPPRLNLDKRASHSRASIWQPPSFVESLDSIFRSQVNRQILLFVLGFICPLTWVLGAVLPIPNPSVSATDLEKNTTVHGADEIASVMMQHHANDVERCLREDRAHAKGHWWRTLNRFMSVVGVLVISAVIAIAVVATR